MAKYDDMINLDHPARVIGRPMSLSDRAKIFLPFAALTGYDASVSEAGRYKEEQLALGTDKVRELDEVLREISRALQEGDFPQVNVEYYDTVTQLYKNISGNAVRTDDMDGFIIVDKTKINFSDIYDIVIL